MLGWGLGNNTVALHPTDLDKIKAGVESGAFKNTSEFLRSVALMFANLIMSVESTSEVSLSSYL